MDAISRVASWLQTAQASTCEMMKRAFVVCAASALGLSVALIMVRPVGATITYSPSTDRGVTCSGHPCMAAITCPTASCDAAELQTALNSAWLGDTITLEAGKVWTTAVGITLKRRTSGSGVLTVRTSTPDGRLPAPGTRITPLYKPLLPELRLTSSAAYSLVIVEQSPDPVENIAFLGVWFSTAPGVNNNSARMISTWVAVPNWYTVTGATIGSTVTLRMASTNGFTEGAHVAVTCTQGDGAGACGVSGVTGWWTVTHITPTTLELVGPVAAGVYTSGLMISLNTQYAAAMTADNITIDRCLILPDPLSQIKNGITVGGRTHTIRDSYFDHLKSNNDSQSISMPNAVGPVLITNNYLGGGSGENIITGGAEPNVPNLHASDLTITHNTIYKDPALYKWEAWSPATWVRAGKIITNGTNMSWIATTSGTTGLTQPAMPTNVCTAPLACSGECCVTDGTVTWQRNFLGNGWNDHWTVKNLFELKSAERVVARWNVLDGAWSDGQSGTAFVFNSTKQTNIGQALLQHIEFGNNVIRNIGAVGAVISRQDYGDGDTDDVYLHDNLAYNLNQSSDAPMLMIAGRTNVPSYLTGLRIEHNTFDRRFGGYGGGVMNTFLNFATSETGHIDGPSFANNIINVSGMLYPAICFSCQNTTAMYKAALDAITLGRAPYTFAGNVLAGENLANWPARNYNTAWSSIGFSDAAAGDFSLQNGSPHRNGGTDGRDIGADTTQLPLIRHLTVMPTTTTAQFTWDVSAPIQNLPCVIEVSSDRAFSSYVRDLDPTLYYRPDTSDRQPRVGTNRGILIGANYPLSDNTTFWYRLHCGGAFEQGRFTTAAQASASLQAVTGTTSLVGGTQGTLTIALNAPAPSGGKTVSVTSSQPTVASLPASPVSIPAGQISVTVPFASQAVSASTTVTFTAVDPVRSIPVVVTILPATASLKSAVAGTTSLVGGTQGTLTIALSAPAPSGGKPLSITSSQPGVVSVASSPVSVPAGQTALTVSFSTQAVSVNSTVTVTVADAGRSIPVVVTILPATASLRTAVRGDSTVVGGKSGTIYLYLTGPAPTGGKAISITSSQLAVIPVTSPVIVPAGQASLTLTVPTRAVSSGSIVTVTVADAAMSIPVVLTVLPSALQAAVRGDATVIGGNAGNIYIYLSGPAPTGGKALSITSSQPTAIPAISPVIVPAGQTTTTMTVPTRAVSASCTVTITVTDGAISIPVVVTVLPASLRTAVRGDATVVGGNMGALYVYLTGPAPSGGKAISITSSQSSLIPIASPVIVPAGQTTLTVLFPTKAVSSSIAATLTVADSALSIPVVVTLLPKSLRASATGDTLMQPADQRADQRPLEFALRRRDCESC